MATNTKKKEYNQRYYARLRSEGLCTAHAKEPRPCAACKAEYQEHKAERLARGLCVGCGKRPVQESRVSCVDCLARASRKQSEKQIKRRDSGMCMYAGCLIAPAAGHTLCTNHLVAMRERAAELRHQRTRAGLCYTCGCAVEIPPHSQCLTCETTQRKQQGSVPLPRYVRKMIKAGLREYRERETRELLSRYLYLIKPRERDLVSQVYGLNSGKRQTLTAVAKEFGFGRERARQIHDKSLLRMIGWQAVEDLPLPLRSVHARLQKYPQELNAKLRARQRSDAAVKRGLLKRQPCVRCGAEKAEKHHPDYSKPLDVVWLCRPCHDQEHHPKETTTEQAA